MDVVRAPTYVTTDWRKFNQVEHPVNVVVRAPPPAPKTRQPLYMVYKYRTRLMPQQPFLFPNLAAFRNADVMLISSDDTITKRKLVDFDVYPNIALKETQSVPLKRTIQPEPIQYKKDTLEIIAFPNLAVRQPYINRNAPCPVEPTYRKVDWQQPEVYPNVALAATYIIPGTPIFLTGLLPGGVKYIYYLSGIGVTGDPVIALSVIAGALPPGLFFENDGTIHGIPTHEGSYDFTIHAVNGVGATDKVYNIVISSFEDGSTHKGLPFPWWKRYY